MQRRLQFLRLQGKNHASFLGALISLKSARVKHCFPRQRWWNADMFSLDGYRWCQNQVFSWLSVHFRFRGSDSVCHKNHNRLEGDKHQPRMIILSALWSEDKGREKQKAGYFYQNCPSREKLTRWGVTGEVNIAHFVSPFLLGPLWNFFLEFDFLKIPALIPGSGLK